MPGIVDSVMGRFVKDLGVGVAKGVAGLAQAADAASPTGAARRIASTITGTPDVPQEQLNALENELNQMTDSQIVSAFGENMIPLGGKASKVKLLMEMAANGTLGAVAQYISPNSTLGKLLIQVGVPLAGATVTGGIKQFATNPKRLTGTPDEINMLTSAEAASDPRLLAIQETVAGNPQTAKRYQDFINKREAKWEGDLKALMPRLSASNEVNGKRAADAIQNRLQSDLNSIKAQNQANYTKALTNPEPIIPVDVLRDKVQQHIDELKKTTSDGVTVLSPDSARLLVKFEDLKSRMFHRTSLTMKEFDDFYKYFGSNSSSSDNLTKVMSKDMNQALKERLDDIADGSGSAADSAKYYQKAVEDAAFGKDVEKYYSDFLINRLMPDMTYGPKQTPNGELLWDRLKNMSEGQRQFVQEMIGRTNPEVMDNIRKGMFQDLMSKGVRTGAAANKSAFDPQAALKAFDEMMTTDPDKIKFLFPDKPSQDAFIGKMNVLRKAVQSTPIREPASSDTAKLISGGVGAVTGRPGASTTSLGFIQRNLNKIVNPDELMDLLTNPAIKPMGLVERLGREYANSPVVSATGNVAREKIQQDRQEYVDPELERLVRESLGQPKSEQTPQTSDTELDRLVRESLQRK